MIEITLLRDGTHKIEFSSSGIDFKCAVEAEATRSATRVRLKHSEIPPK